MASFQGEDPHPSSQVRCAEPVKVEAAATHQMYVRAGHVVPTKSPTPWSSCASRENIESHHLSTLRSPIWAEKVIGREISIDELHASLGEARV